MRLGDLADVILIIGVGKALVVHHHVILLRPLGIVIEIDLRVGSLSSLVDQGSLTANLGTDFKSSRSHPILSSACAFSAKFALTNANIKPTNFTNFVIFIA